MGDKKGEVGLSYHSGRRGFRAGSAVVVGRRTKSPISNHFIRFTGVSRSCTGAVSYVVGAGEVERLVDTVVRPCGAR
jgi:hypothetical protein